MLNHYLPEELVIQLLVQEFEVIHEQVDQLESSQQLVELQ